MEKESVDINKPKTPEVKSKRKYKRFYQKPEWLIPLVLTIVLFIIGLFFYGPKLDSTANLPSTNTTSDIESTQIPSNQKGLCSGYVNEISLTNNAIDKENLKIDLLNVKFILKNNQEVFIKKYDYHKTFKVGCCNEEYSDCYIYYEFQIPKKYKTCFVIAFSDDLGNKMFLGQNYTSKDCYNILNGSIEHVNLVFNTFRRYED
ncbi:hypothetical protein HYW20_00235 [Candidatus Woesearchaeota archaeon]|nr:hypothetical protein [Candidatus Woesearchaeota archaeon]